MSAVSVCAAVYSEVLQSSTGTGTKPQRLYQYYGLVVEEYKLGIQYGGHFTQQYRYYKIARHTVRWAFHTLVPVVPLRYGSGTKGAIWKRKGGNLETLFATGRKRGQSGKNP